MSTEHLSGKLSWTSRAEAAFFSPFQDQFPLLKNYHDFNYFTHKYRIEILMKGLIFSIYFLFTKFIGRGKCHFRHCTHVTKIPVGVPWHLTSRKFQQKQKADTRADRQLNYPRNKALLRRVFDS